MNTTIASAPSVLPEVLPGAPAADEVPPAGRMPWRKLLLVAMLVVGAGAGGGLYAYRAAGFETTDNAYVEGNIHPVSARIGGTVTRVLVDDNVRVAAGDPLVEIDSTDLKLALQAAEAELAQARAASVEVSAQINRAQAAVESATARIAQNAAQLKRAELDFRRAEELAGNKGGGVISQSEFDAARAAFEAAQAAQHSLEAERSAANAALAAMQAQRDFAAAQMRKAETAAASAKLQVDYTVVRAATSGRVARKSVEVGQRLQPGQPIMALVGEQVWVVANFKESQLARMEAGDRVDIRIDAIEGRDFHGVVESFSPGTGSKFSLLPPDNSTGNFTKVVQRVPVKILFADAVPAGVAGRLAPGLSAVVKVGVRE